MEDPRREPNRRRDRRRRGRGRPATAHTATAIGRSGRQIPAHHALGGDEWPVRIPIDPDLWADFKRFCSVQRLPMSRLLGILAAEYLADPGVTLGPSGGQPRPVQARVRGLDRTEWVQVRLVARRTGRTVGRLFADLVAATVSGTRSPDLSQERPARPEPDVEVPSLGEAGDTVRQVEALIMVASEPVSAGELAVAVGCDTAAVEAILGGLADSYRGRGFCLRCTASGWRIYAEADMADVVDRFHARPQPLSQQAVETLAVVAYRPGITCAELEDIRGVTCDSMLRRLDRDGLVSVCGVGPHGDQQWQATAQFYDLLGLSGPEGLPELAGMAPPAGTAAGVDGLRAGPLADRLRRRIGL